jgi:hypothetical protein
MGMHIRAPRKQYFVTIATISCTFFFVESPFIFKLYRYIQQMVENYERHEKESSVAHLHIE